MSDVIGVIYCDYEENTINVLEIDDDKLMDGFNGNLEAYVAAYVGSTTYEWMAITKDTKIDAKINLLKDITKELLNEKNEKGE